MTSSSTTQAEPPDPNHRRTASTITDPELDNLYAQRDLLLLLLTARLIGVQK